MNPLAPDRSETRVRAGAGNVALRIGAGVLALVAAAPIFPALGIAVLNVLIAAQYPDPSVPNGDPCCGHPDTWGEVALGFVYAAMLVLGAVAAGYLATGLGGYAMSGCLPSRRQWRQAGVAAACVAVAVAVVFLGP